MAHNRRIKRGREGERSGREAVTQAGGCPSGLVRTVSGAQSKSRAPAVRHSRWKQTHPTPPTSRRRIHSGQAQRASTCSSAASASSAAPRCLARSPTATTRQRAAQSRSGRARARRPCPARPTQSVESGSSFAGCSGRCRRRRRTLGQTEEAETPPRKTRMPLAGRLRVPAARPAAAPDRLRSRWRRRQGGPAGKPSVRTVIVAEGRSAHICALVGGRRQATLETRLEKHAHDVRLRARRMQVVRRDGVKEGGTELEKTRELLGGEPRRLRRWVAVDDEVGRHETLNRGCQPVLARAVSWRTHLSDQLREEGHREGVGDAGLPCSQASESKLGHQRGLSRTIASIPHLLCSTIWSSRISFLQPSDRSASSHCTFLH